MYGHLGYTDTLILKEKFMTTCLREKSIRYAVILRKTFMLWYRGQLKCDLMQLI